MLALGNATTSATINGQKITVYTYRPKLVKSIMLVFHGLSRTAGSYRDYAIPFADRHGMAVYAPLFDLARFPSWSYQRGGIVNDGVIQPRDKWTIGYVKGLLAWARAREALPGAPYYLFGHSAGAQFSSRVAGYALSDAKRIVVANPSTHVLPSLTEAVPYGFGCIKSACAFGPTETFDQLKAYLALPLTIYLGEDDTGDEDLSTSSAAMRQGATRLERGQNTFAMGKDVAAKAGWPFNWRLVVLPGVGHSAKELLQSDQTDVVFGLK